MFPSIRLQILVIILGLGLPAVMAAGATGNGPSIWQAAKSGDVAQIKQQIAAKANLNAPDMVKGWTPLIYAIMGNHPDAVKELLQAGADPTLYSGRTHLSPLGFAAAEGHLQIMRLLLDKGVDPQNTAPPALSPLMQAASNGHLDAIQLLLDRGADPNQLDNNDRTALMIAAVNGKIEAMKLLMDRGARIQGGFDGLTALTLAARSGQYEAVQFLLDKGADPRENNGDTSAIRQAVSANHAKVAILLLDHGAPLDQSFLLYKHSLVSDAARNGNLELMKELMRRGDRYRPENDDGLEEAAMGNHLSCLKLLLDQGFHPPRPQKLIEKTVERGYFQVSMALFQDRRSRNAGGTTQPAATAPATRETREPDAQTRLLVAAYEDNAPVAEQILKTGAVRDLLVLKSAKQFALQRGNIAVMRVIAPAADTAIKFADEQKALNKKLEAAADQGDQKAVAGLLQRGAEANALSSDDYGGPLISAVESRHLEVVKLLLDHGAQINRQYGGCTALGSVRKNDIEMVKFLLARGADPNLRSDDVAPLVWAAGNNDVQAIRLLLNAHARINELSVYGTQTPLMSAVKNNCAEAVKLLLENGADLAIKNNKGDTAMSIALANGNTKVAAILRQHGAPMQPTKAVPSMNLILTKGYEGVKEWLNHGGDPNIVIPQWGGLTTTPMGSLIERNYGPSAEDLKIAELLISRGADVSKVHDSLTLAIKHKRSIPFLKLLVDHGADVNAAMWERLPVVEAIHNGTLEQVKFLVQAGARLDIRLSEGQTPLDIAREAKRTDIVVFLQQAMAGATSKPANQEK